MFANTQFKELTRLEEFTEWLNRHALNFATDKSGNVVGLVNMLTFEEEAIVDRLAALSDLAHFATFWESHKQWIVGDAINMGLREAGEIFAQHLSNDTLANWSAVCARYTHAERVGGLSFTHHQEVAYLTDKRRRAALLEIAATTPNFTVAQLRALKNADSGGNDAPLFVTGMKRFSIADGFKLGLINEQELSDFAARGCANLRIEYTITGE